MKVKVLRASASGGASRLISALKRDGFNVQKLLIRGSTYRGFPSHVVINWGSTDRRLIREGMSIVNEPEAVANATNKVSTLRILEENGHSLNIPKWTTSSITAGSWITDEYDKVYCRTLTRGSQGRGIVYAETVDELVPAPLYTAALDVKREIRVHVFQSSVIDFAQKKKISAERREEEGIVDPDMRVRSHQNGWIFAREGVSIPQDAKDVAVASVASLGLDFGAVDIVITRQGVPKVLEINTAPGLEGTTLERYTDAFRTMLQLQ